MSLPAYDAPRRPCAECPWRRDVPIGHFPPERFQALAHTAYDLSTRVFTCHKSAEDHPIVCAGFLSRGAEHNLSVRLAYARGQLDPAVRAGDIPLYEDYRAMAVANGVPLDDPSLQACRGRRAPSIAEDAREAFAHGG